MSTQPVDVLEFRALEQRNKIHVTAQELKGKISQAKKKLDVTKKLRRYLFAWAIVFGAASLLGALIARRFKR
jgi:hypothetical protein